MSATSSPTFGDAVVRLTLQRIDRWYEIRCEVCGHRIICGSPDLWQFTLDEAIARCARAHVHNTGGVLVDQPAGG